LTSLPSTESAATSLRRVRIAAGFGALLLIAAALVGAGSDVLLAIPVVFLVSALLMGRYPGLTTLVRLLFGTRILRGPPSVTRAAA
jgi:hypothetical protein